MDFAAPSGPPPPKVPAGWLARWNEQYSEWFYVNIYTKTSTWERPTEPVYPPQGTDSEAPPGPPPTYDPANSQNVSDTKHAPTGDLGSNNPYGGSHPPTDQKAHAPDLSEDEALARRLQEEEDARAKASSSSRGASDSYYGAGGQGSSQQGYPQSYDQQLPPRPEGKKGGFLSKLSSKLGGGSSSSRNDYPPQQRYSGGGGYPQGYPPQQYGGGYQQGYPQGYPPQQYGQPYGGGYGGGYGGYQQRPPRRGMGAGGAAALGVGGGLLGGMLLADAMDGNDYQEGYDDGMDAGGGDDGGGGD